MSLNEQVDQGHTDNGKNRHGLLRKKTLLRMEWARELGRLGVLKGLSRESGDRMGCLYDALVLWLFWHRRCPLPAALQ